MKAWVETREFQQNVFKLKENAKECKAITTLREVHISNTFCEFHLQKLHPISEFPQ